MPKSRDPQGDLAIRTLAMPADTNPNGDVFGGWVVSQMDLAGLSVARGFTQSNVVTVAIDQMSFYNPVHVGDFVCCYSSLVKTGRTSMTIKIETWALSGNEETRRLVTEGTFVFVCVDENGRPTPIKPER